MFRYTSPLFARTSRQICLRGPHEDDFKLLSRMMTREHAETYWPRASPFFGDPEKARLCLKDMDRHVRLTEKHREPADKHRQRQEMPSEPTQLVIADDGNALRGVVLFQYTDEPLAQRRMDMHCVMDKTAWEGHFAKDTVRTIAEYGFERLNLQAIGALAEAADTRISAALIDAGFKCWGAAVSANSNGPSREKPDINYFLLVQSAWQKQRVATLAS